MQGATGGRHIRDVIREEIAEPLGIADEMFVGIPDGVEERLTTLTALPRPADAPAAAGAAGERGRIGPATPFDFNDMAMRKVCLPSGNGHFSARALARMYGALANGGELDGVRLVSAERIPAMWRPTTDAYDQVLMRRLVTL